MTPSDYAAEELSLWEQALREQRDAEDRLARARQARELLPMYELVQEVDNLRTRADLLLAEAVKVKCAFRDEQATRL